MIGVSILHAFDREIEIGPTDDSFRGMAVVNLTKVDPLSKSIGQGLQKIGLIDKL